MAAGVRPIDSIVDITNYIMLEYGQPLHAFDLDAVGTGELYVRRATDGEVIRTLDGKDRKLTTDDLVVTNGTDPVALAGVMGGENTHITDDTQTIAIESAIFDPVLVRRTGHKLNLRSEASARFEKGINEATVLEALDKTANLMQEIGGGEIVSGIQAVSALDKEEPVVSVTLDELKRLVGVEFTSDQVSKIFDRLGFDHVESDGKFDVTIPKRRWDISISADLVEEVARIYGYNNIPSTLPETESVPGEFTPTQRLKRHLKDFLQHAGFSEAISYALTTKEKASRFASQNFSDLDPVHLSHPMSADHQTLRQSILTGLLDVAQYNQARQLHNIQLFELGTVFGKSGDDFVQTIHLGGLLKGNLTEDSWSEKARQIDFYTAKGLVEEIFDLVGLAQPISYRPTSQYPGMHPGRTADVYAGDRYLGFLGQVHPSIASDYDLSEVYVFELDVQALVEEDKEPIIYDLIPKYPGTSRDIALLVDVDVTHQEIVDIIEESSSDLLQTIHLFDLYQGENIEDGKQSLAYSLFYQDPTGTLKDDQVDSEFEKVKTALQEKLSASIR